MRQSVRIEASDSNDYLRLSPEPEINQWDKRLLWFMRILSFVWLLKGISSWLIIFGIWSPHFPFYTATMGYQSIVVYFAVTDPIAAIGLWMATAWGGILWLLAIVTNIILALFFPQIIPGGTIVPYIYAFLVLCYLIMSWLASKYE